MIVARHWAQARLQEKRPGRQITLYRFGWSNESAEDAQRMAEQRVREAMARAWAGEQLDRRERKLPYNGADGMPIREEIVAEYGSTIITRNCYGARCLNTPDVLIADIDFEGRDSDWVTRIGCLSAVVAVVVGAVVSTSLAVGLMVGVGVLAAVHTVWWLVKKAHIALAGGSTHMAMTRLRNFCAAHPTWRMHVYQTPAGLRVLATHRRFDPVEAEVKAFFDDVQVDPMYARMTLLQRCFRARLSAKPWRIGIAKHLHPRPGVWPINPARLPERRAWLEAYDAKAADFAACRALEVIGTGAVDPEAERVRLLHDELCGATSRLPLA